MKNQSICLNASITQSKLPIMIQTQIQANQYEMRRDDLKKFATLSRANAKYNYLRQFTLTLKMPNRTVMTKFGWLKEKSCKRWPTNSQLELDVNQSICFNASVTQSKLPIMMQTQIRATNMRWGGMTLKSLQPCFVSMPNTTIRDNWLSHYNCQTEMWWPNLDDWKRNSPRDNQ